MLDVDAVWEVFDTGEICVTMRVKKEMEFPELPRIRNPAFFEAGI